MKRIGFILLLLILSLTLFCQTHWTKHPDNPVMVSTEEWEGDYVLPRSVIYHDSMYHMWYWGAKDDNSGYPSYPYKEAIGYAISPDGINWTKDPINPVLEPGPEGAWDDHLIHGCSVILHDSIFHMWYNGHSGQNIERKWGIGHATSPDGIYWSKDTNNPVLVQGQAGEWDELLIELNSVIHDGENFQMWYNGAGYKGGRWCGRAGHAISPDGVNWREDSLNPILIPENDWEGKMVFFLNTVFDGDNYKMWYTGGSGYNWEVGYATSDDGSIWEKHDRNPVLSTGLAGSWDQKHVGAGPVIDSAGVKYKMWYVGGQKDDSQRIGYAESSPFVEIPDTAFLYALIDEGVDTNGDSLISFEEAEAINSLEVGFYGISDMTGIEAFVNLDSLHCYFNSLTSLDVSNNLALTSLMCERNLIDSLDLSKNIALKELYCRINQLTNLNLSVNTYLQRLHCSGNQIESLDLSNNLALTHLECGASMLIPGVGADPIPLFNLDISANTALQNINISQMPSLHEVCVWESFPLGVDLDTVGSPNICFQTDCNGDCSIVGIVDDIHESGISIYPNPANTILTIETVSSYPIEYDLTSLNGQKILIGELEGTAHQLDLSSFQKGVYFITIKSKDYVATRKIIKL